MINSYTSWQPLREVIVGRAYTPEYFDFIENTQVRQQLQQILHETNEDLDTLQKTIETWGCKVHRPNLPPLHWFEKQQILHKPIPLPPLTPRDWQITLGNKLLRVVPVRELDGICNLYADQVVDPHHGTWDPNCILNGASASCIVRVGRDVFFDNSSFLTSEQSRWIQQNLLDHRYRVHEAITDGHGDAVFAILKPGVILSSKHDELLNFSREFPNWDVLRILDSSIDAALEIGKYRHENGPPKWYVQGQTPTAEFASYVDIYLKEWTGFVAETVFDVNCLVLDESHVIFSSYNKAVFDYCRKHKIEPIICELRHRFFWDGGISCCTQDLHRDGGLETYL